MAKTYNVGRLSVEMVADTVQYVQKMKSAETTTKKTQKGIGGAIQDTGTKSKKAAKGVNKLDSKLKKLGDAATFVNGPMGGVASRISSLNSLMGGTGGAVAITGGLALGIAAAGTAAMLASIEYAKQYKELKIYADVAGVATREMRLLSGATKTVGISTEKFGDITKDVQDKIGDFVATGGGEFANVMDVLGDKLGYTAVQLQNMSGPDALEAVAHAMQRANIPMGQQIFLMESIANDSSRLLPLYANLSEEMNKQKDITEKLTRAMDEDLLSVYTELDKATTRLKDNMLDATADGLSPFAEQVTELANAMNFWLASLEDGSKAADRYRMAEIRNEMDDTRKSISNLTTASGRFSNVIALESTDAKVLRTRLMELSNEYDKLNIKVNTKQEKTKPEPAEVDPQAFYDSKKFEAMAKEAERRQKAQEADEKRIAEAHKKRLKAEQKEEKDLNDAAIADDLEFQNEITQLKKRHDDNIKKIDKETKKREKKEKKEKKEAHDKAIDEDEQFYDAIMKAKSDYEQSLTDSYNLQAMALSSPMSEPTDEFDNQLALLKLNGERELELLRQQYAHKTDLESEYQAAMKATKNQYYADVLAAHQASAMAELNLARDVGNQIGAQQAALAGAATEEEKDALKKQFLIKQAMAAANATLDYFATLSAHEATAATLGVAGGAYLATQTALATTNYQRNLGGIAAVAIGGQFHSGTDNVPSEGSYLLQQGERVIQPKANKDLTEFISKGGSGSNGVTIEAPINVSGNVTDEKWFAAQLVKQRNVISSAVRKSENERPKSRRR